MKLKVGSLLCESENLLYMIIQIDSDPLQPILIFDFTLNSFYQTHMKYIKEDIAASRTKVLVE